MSQKRSKGVARRETTRLVVSRLATPLDRFWLNWVSRPDFLTYNIDRLPQPALVRLRETGLPVLGWTVRHARQLTGLDGVFDNVIAEGEAMQHLLGDMVPAASSPSALPPRLAASAA